MIGLTVLQDCLFGFYDFFRIRLFLRIGLAGLLFGNSLGSTVFGRGLTAAGSCQDHDSGKYDCHYFLFHMSFPLKFYSQSPESSSVLQIYFLRITWNFAVFNIDSCRNPHLFLFRRRNFSLNCTEK